MSKLFDLINSLIDRVNSSVKTTPQTLTEEEKTQVKDNLGLSDVITPDWNQTDETAPDYIKNRTHYMAYTIDGDSYAEMTVISGSTYRCNSRVYPATKIQSDATFFATIDGEIVLTTPIDSHTTFQQAIVSVFGMIGDDITIYTAKMDRKTGKYGLSVTVVANRDCTLRYGYVHSISTKQLDEVYIPSTIARVTDIPTGVVKYDETQTLTSEQQSQARVNIGIDDVITPDMMMELLYDTGAVVPVTDIDGSVITTSDDEILIL